MLTQQNDEARTRPRTNAGGLTDVKLGHLLHALGRYRPVFAVVAFVLVLAVMLPGPPVIGGTDFAAAPESSGSSGAPAAAPVGAAEAPQDSFSAPAPLGGAMTYNPQDTSDPFATTETAAVDDDFGADVADRDPPASTSSGAATRTTVRRDDPLKIVAAAWASRTAGTPVAATGVPEKSLPVGKRLGQDDKLSFIRVDGDKDMLILSVVAEGDRSGDTARIRACQVTEPGWEQGTAVAFDAAPAYDAGDCVEALHKKDGTWAFDLSKYPSRDDARGFALVPHPEAPLDFQVAFVRA